MRWPLLLAALVLAAEARPGPDSDHPLRWADRVVGGDEVQEGSVKWTASLQSRTTQSHFCGGTVINDYWVLTAAHCMMAVEMDDFQIVTGGTDLDGSDLQVRLPARVVTADYDPVDKSNDMSLIKASEPLQPSSRLSGEFMRLAEGSPRPGTECMVLGWGYTQAGGTTVRRLQGAMVTIRSPNDCQQAYSGMGYSITETMLCAGGGPRDACQGDSGGPLVCRADGDRAAATDRAADLQLVGAVSWGVRCASPGLPGVYADVAAMVSWIQDNVD